RYGIQADVAGKTGTTQDNTDGWFILMNPRVVAGAWAGFNDGRVTLRSDQWGQGARSALPMVGDFMQQAIRNKVIDGKERFFDEFENSPPPPAELPPPADGSLGSMRDWIRGLFGSEGRAAPQAPGQPPAPWPGGLPPVTHDPPGSSMPLPPAEERMGG
ncbi:MAG: penicillin-binding protein, partial [Comamonadaceae bacterium]